MKANQENLHKIMFLWEHGELDKAMDLLRKEMQRATDDPRCISMAGHIYEKSGNVPVAYNLFKLAAESQPSEASHWLNLGRSAEDLWRTAEAERAYKRALSLCNRDTTKIHIFGNLSALHIDNARYEEAMKWVDKSLSLDPAHKGALSNKGFCQLAQGNWAEGWKNYGNNVGTEARKKVTYGTEPQWEGQPDSSVVFYGEQGLGDEICFASMIDDATALCSKVVIDCDARLANLFKRSFPMATIYGTRNAKKLNWAEADRNIDYSLPMGQMGEYLRTDIKQCTREPYLTADPDRVTMWKALWATKGKPVIGIAWSGGTYRTASDMRLAPLSEWGDLLDIDAHFVSLQYKGDETHPKIHEYPYATRTQDYDDTAALVASLDMVVSVPTAVAHLAGALGTKVIAMHGPNECWKYHCGIPFHPATHVAWQGSWKNTISKAATLLRDASSCICEHGPNGPPALRGHLKPSQHEFACPQYRKEKAA